MFLKGKGRRKEGERAESGRERETERDRQTDRQTENQSCGERSHSSSYLFGREMERKGSNRKQKEDPCASVVAGGGSGQGLPLKGTGQIITVALIAFLCLCDIT